MHVEAELFYQSRSSGGGSRQQEREVTAQMYDLIDTSTLDERAGSPSGPPRSLCLRPSGPPQTHTSRFNETIKCWNDAGHQGSY